MTMSVLISKYAIVMQIAIILLVHIYASVGLAFMIKAMEAVRVYDIKSNHNTMI